MAEELWREVGVFERLLWKNRSQHRHARYFQHCLGVTQTPPFLSRPHLHGSPCRVSTCMRPPDFANGACSQREHAG